MSENRLDQFDRQTRTITQDRGKDYRHPSVDFATANKLKAVVQDCSDPLVRHTLEMICLKLARLIGNPSHLDSWVDIAGYARCGVMVTEPSRCSVLVTEPAVVEDKCPGHVASKENNKICAWCGIHIDSLRLPEDDPRKG